MWVQFPEGDYSGVRTRQLISCMALAVLWLMISGIDVQSLQTLKDCKLVPSDMPDAEIDLIFIGQRFQGCISINFEQFKDALKLLADKAGLGFDKASTSTHRRRCLRLSFDCCDCT